MKTGTKYLTLRIAIPICCGIVILLLPLASAGAGQQPQEKSSDAVQGASAPAASGEYASEPLVIEQMDHRFAFNADGTGSREITVAARAQSDAVVRQLGLLTIPFTGNTEHVELSYVRVRHNDGTVTETPASAAIEVPNPAIAAAPLYSDLKQLQVPVRSLHVGDRLEWQAKILITKPESPGQFWGADSFTSDAVILEESIELRIPKDLSVEVWSGSIKPVESSTETERVYRWEFSQKKPTVGAQAEAEKERKKKQVLTAAEELDAKEGKLPDAAWTTFKNWAEVGAWYRNLEGDRASGTDAEIKAKTVEVIAGKSSQEDKVRAIYNYVSTQIRYIGVDFGNGRYQPHSATDVLDYQYGDCKDKHTLMAAMLRAAGFHPEAVLIGANLRFQESVPSPQSFNHLITRVDVDGKPVWLDSTTEVAPYRALLYVLRDKSALVIPAEGASTVERTPADLPYPARDQMDAQGSLDENGISHSRLVMTFRGDGEVLIRAALHQLTADHYDELVQRIVSMMGYGGTTSHAEVSNPADTGEPLRIAFDYLREKGGDWEHLQIVPQLTPIIMPRVEESNPPIQAIELGAPHRDHSTSAMKLPAGWTAKLPDAKHVKSPWITYDQTYRFENGTVYSERTVEVLKKEIPVADWKEYKKFTDDADPGNEPYIRLFKPGSNPSSVVGLAPMNDSKAAELIFSAVYDKTDDPNLLNSAAYMLADHNVGLPLAEPTVIAALSKLDEESKGFSVRENINQAMGKSHLIALTWDTLGWIYYREGKFTQAENYIQAAWKSTQNSELGLHLSEIEKAKGNSDEALRYLLLAQATISKAPPGQKREPTAMEKKLADKIEELHKAGAKDPAIDVAQALIQLRTFSLGPANGASGTAEYRLLLGDGKVLDLEKIGDKEIPGMEDRIKEAGISLPLPEGSKARLVRNVAVTCVGGKCELVIEP